MFAYVRWKGLSARLNTAVTDAFGTADSRGSWYLDTNATLLLKDQWSLGAHAGRKQSRGTNPLSGARNSQFSYTDYKLSAARLFGGGLSATLAWTWTTARTATYTG